MTVHALSIADIHGFVTILVGIALNVLFSRRLDRTMRQRRPSRRDPASAAPST